MNYDLILQTAHENQERWRPCCQVDHIVVDANNLNFRISYMAREEGVDGILVGILEKLVMLKWWYGAKAVHVVWEGQGRNWRYDYLPDYKANRKGIEDDGLREMTIEVRSRLRSLLRGTVFKQYDPVDGEGDDGFGTLATQLAEAGDTVGIYSMDGDLLQLTTDKILCIVPKRGDVDVALNAEKVVEKLGFGLVPSQIKELKGLEGDTGDNIPGVPGIGKKIATGLIAQYGTLDGVIEAAQSPDLDKIEGESKTKYAKRIKEEFGATEKKRNSILEFETQARKSRDAGGIKTDIELKVLEHDPSLAKKLEGEIRYLGASDYLLERLESFRYG